MALWLAGAAVVGTVGGIYSARKGGEAGKDAAQLQSQSVDKGIAVQQEQFAAIQKLLAPYVGAGVPAQAAQQDLLGLNGMKAQQGAVNGIAGSPMFGAMAAQGEDAILQNASATGGLRGGNVQGALAQFRPQLLNQLIDQQYQRLGGQVQVGVGAATGTGVAGMQTGTNVSQLLQQQGAAQAGGVLAQGKAYGQMANAVTSGFGTFVGAKF